MQKADGQSVKALFNFAGCGECGLAFCFWQRRSGPRKTLLRTKRYVCSAANSVATCYTKLCQSRGREAIHSPRNGNLLWKIRRRSEEHTSELQSRRDLVCRLLLEK